MNEEYTYNLKDSYIHAYMGDEGRKQIQKWKKCEKHHNMNFSFPAFFFSFFWYFYKRAYKAGFVFLALIVVLPNIAGVTTAVITVSDVFGVLSEYKNAEAPKYTIDELNKLEMSGSFDGTEEEFDSYYRQAQQYAELSYKAAAAAAEFDTAYKLAFYVVDLILNLIAALFFDYFLFRKIRYSIFYEMAGMKSDEESAVIDCLSRARESDKTKEKGLRTLLITAYVVYIAIQLFFMW
ncbi:MAG: DUF2628 domain-containing protein [Oscillospiraceae bacterium]|nr:DUF2628 domain-containing protein [Oscillospiraceae bacterium]